MRREDHASGGRARDELILEPVLESVAVDARLVVPAITAWTSAWLLIGAPQLSGLITVVAWILVLAVVAAAVITRRPWLPMVALAIVAVAVIGTSVGIAREAREPAALVEAAESGRLINLTVTTTETVRGEPNDSGSGGADSGIAGAGSESPGDAGEFSAGAPSHLNPQPYAATIIDVERASEHGNAASATNSAANSAIDSESSSVESSVESSAESSAASSPVLVFGAKPPGTTGIGVTLGVRGTIVAAEAGDRVAYLVFASGEPTVLAQASPFLAGVNSLRKSFGELVATLPGTGGDLLPGLSIGDTSAVSDTLDSAMKVSSLSHLTAVSGANCAVVIGLIMLGGGLLRLSRGWRISASILVLIGFVVLVTPEPSVVRAAVMAVVVLIALAAGRPVRGVAVLAFAVIMVLIGDPWLARNYGFVLSVLATGGLIVLAGPLARRMSLFMPLPLAVVIAVPLAAQLACQPVLILLNPAIPLYGVVANLLAAPAAPLATVLGLLACVLLPAVPVLAGWCAWIAWAPSSWVAAVALFFSSLPGAQLPWPPGILGLFALTLASTAMLALIFSRSRSRLRTVAIVGTLCLVVLMATTVIGVTVTKNLNRPPGWQIALCDVGQGDAVLVRSAGQVALIDTGAEPALLRDCLAETGVDTLDLLVLTHFDFDHVGGASALVGKATRVIHSPPDGERDKRLLRDFDDAGADVDQVARGVTGILGELRWSVLSPSARSAAGEAATGNDASVVMLFTPVGECAGGCLSAILLGDLGERAQDRLRALQQLPAVDVVKVSHHGSADQSPELYQRISATVGIIGVGAENTYGHPTESTLDVLATSATRVVRSDLDGLALLAPGNKPGEVLIWTEKATSGGP